MGTELLMCPLLCRTLVLLTVTYCMPIGYDDDSVYIQTSWCVVVIVRHCRGDGLKALIRLEGVSGKGALPCSRNGLAHHVEGFSVERLAQRLVGRGALQDHLAGAVWHLHLHLITDDVRTREDKLEQRWRESREELDVLALGRRRRALGVGAQVPEDDHGRWVGVAAHLPAHLGKAASNALEVGLPAVSASVRLVKLHVREDDYVGDFVGLEPLPLGHVEDELGRLRKVGGTAPGCLAHLTHLVSDARVRVQRHPLRAALEGKDAVAEGGRRELRSEDPESNGHLHRNAVHATAHVHEGHELAQVHRQFGLGRRSIIELLEVPELVADALGLLELRAHVLAQVGPLRVQHLLLGRREVPAANLGGDLVRLQRLALERCRE
mmetsp:Transcript_14158/g.38133  ORF Transcript_14158/g.38133 Transcript_14158/m.38133 type:complete len:380 (-) Transcript_14158:1064-2203(-)